MSDLSVADNGVSGLRAGESQARERTEHKALPELGRERYLRAHHRFRPSVQYTDAKLNENEVPRTAWAA